MKIAHVVDSMEVGGAETLVSQLCRLQRAQGHEPEVYAVAALGALGEQLRAEGFVVQANVGRHLPDASLNFFRLFRQSRPDAVHVHNPTPTIYAAPAARMAAVASVVSTRHSLVAPPRNLKMERKYRIAARFCDWIVGICDATTQNLREAGSAPDAKIVRVYNGSTAITRSQPAERSHESGFTFLFVGRLEPVKDIPLLLKAFRVVASQLPDSRLWLVGDGSERIRLEEITDSLGLRSNVSFWGQQMDVSRFFIAADAFVMSSLSEGLPMSLLQALSCGLPAVTTDVGGMAEVVRLADAGMTVPGRSADAMAVRMVRLATDAAERTRFSRNAEAAFEKHFRLSVMAAEYMRLYEGSKRFRRRANQR